MDVPEIQDYQFGRMVVDGEPHTRDLVLLPDRVVANWWRKEGHRLDVEDLREVLDAVPKVLVVGTGAYGRMKVPERRVSNCGPPVRGRPGDCTTSCESGNRRPGRST